jgi:sulfatase modifying factor 1
MEPLAPELPASGLVSRLEQAFELGMALALGLASPVAGLVALLALGSVSLDVAQVGERLVRWGGAGQAGARGHGAGSVIVLASAAPGESPATEPSDGRADEEPSAEREHVAVAIEPEGEAGPEAGPLEQGGGPQDLLGAVAQSEVQQRPPSAQPGLGQPWGTVRHGTGRLLGGGGGAAVAQGLVPAPAVGGSPPGPPVSQTLDAAAGMRLVAIAGGGFWMGSPEHEEGRFDNEGPRHRVHLSPYWLSSTEVTRAQWRAVLGSEPRGAGGGDAPVVGVSWCDAVRFANALSEREGLTPAYRFRGPCGHGGTVSWDRKADGYRLPTEAEWELAARAGTEAIFAGSPSLEPVGWYLDNAGGGARAVASLQPNAYGLHDMSGNVWEWVWDWLGPYDGAAQRDPTGPERGDVRILRGGSWRYEARYARVADRNWGHAGYRSPAVGFRLARSLRPGDLDALVSED